jgi:hypothetical protein
VKLRQALRELPAGYAVGGTVELSKNRWLAIAVNLAAVGLFFVFGWLFTAAAVWLRPDWRSFNLHITGPGQLLGLLAILLALIVFQVALHELIHGLFFRLYTGARPRYALKLMYAYAAAPDWYLPRDQHLVTALAPLVLMTVGSLGLLPFIPARLIPALLLVMTANAAGAVGDMVVAGWLLRQPPTALVRDAGDAITVYNYSPSASRPK